jgi:Domain of unknown function (DUF6438)
MLWRGVISLLICVVMSSGAYAQEKPLIWPTPPRFPSDLKDFRIKLVRTSCFGFCPDYSVRIYGDGRVVYEGRRLVKIKGKQEGFVSTDAVRQLAHQFFAADYSSLRPFYGDCGGDLPTAVTSIDWPGVSRNVTDCGEAGVVQTIPPALADLEAAIDITVNSRQWVGTDKERMKN